MKRVISGFTGLAKSLVKKAIGLLPPSPSRLSGTLACDGGTPVRDTRFRPWPVAPVPSRIGWMRSVGPAMRNMFLTGAEGLPQRLAGEFAEKWAEYCGTRYALLLPHGTDALRIAVAAALDHDAFEYGGELIVPNLSFIASANAVLDRRVGIALVDVNPETLSLDPAQVESAIVPGKTRGIMAVHLFGQPADMTSLRDIARRHSLVIIEDAAQAHGAIHELGRAGSLGDAAGFSFQSSKNLNSGEGGAFTTNNPEIFERAYAFQNAGRARIGTQRWVHESVGWNVRPTEYIAAVLLHRLKSLESEQERRHTRLLQLHDLLRDIPCVTTAAVGPGVRRHGCHMCVLRYHAEFCDGLDIDGFIRMLRAEGLPVYRSYDMTMAQQPALQRLAEKRPEYIRVLPTPVADSAVRQLIYLPHSLFLGTESDIAEVAAIFKKVQAHFKTGHTRQTPSAPRTTEAAANVGIPSSTPKKQRTRFGIIGVGAQGRAHAAAISQNPTMAVTAVSDANENAARTIATQNGWTACSTADELIESGMVDAIIIATPHWQHPELSIAGLRAGLHVVCEKPVAVTSSAAHDVLEAAAASAGLFAIVHQRRLDPAYAYVKKLLESGELGPIYRCEMVESSWRTDAYYRQSPWRGTWKGEGGGVLLNQAPHLLDLYAWFCGMPKSLVARCDTNLHEIEVEDTATALLLHANGAHGSIHVNTTECPPISRITIACDRGRITIENGEVRLARLRGSIRKTTGSAAEVWDGIEHDSRTVFVSGRPAPSDLLAAFYDNLASTIRGESKLICPANEAAHAVELANAMILSSARSSAVPLPLDRHEYDTLMAELLAERGDGVGSRFLHSKEVLM